MSTSTGQPPRNLRQLDEDMFAMCDDVKEIRRVQKVHGERLNNHGAMLTEIQKNVGVIKKDVKILKIDMEILKTDVTGLKTDVAGLKTDMVEVKNILGVIVSRLPER